MSSVQISENSNPKEIDTRTPEEIEMRLAELRAELTQTVDELTDRVKPANLLADAKASLAEGAKKAQYGAQKLVEDAQQGDPQAIKTLAIAGGVTVAVAALVIWRVLR
ncbi:DUF3618 domain-containing protein [Boudabousia marimammalium]|uniref:DUF3618 domain-containing protein n=1 Tax=Boudabousia marimammalium TaxID=156892 RepID=A0A1Q5PM50_9ACTO|nr:DUF3618 domain-containing protein [Boudabousia marimammalium]OKL48621.1 hypothetical protein BM477_05275 [Boudabousia marimammalium]